MSAIAILRRNRTDILWILSADPHLLINKLHEQHFITFHEHRNLKRNERRAGLVSDVLDLIHIKGETMCRRFLELLRTDEDLKAAFPGLQEKLRDYLELKTLEERHKMNLLSVLEELEDEEFKRFMWFLRHDPTFPWSRLKKAERTDVVDLMMDSYGGSRSRMEMSWLLHRMNRSDLVQRLTEPGGEGGPETQTPEERKKLSFPVSEDEKPLYELQGPRYEDSTYGGPRSLVLQSWKVPEASRGDTASSSSVFDLFWRAGDWIRHSLSSERGQVLLFLSPPEPDLQWMELDVFLLPSSVPVDEVRKYYPNAKHIRVPSACQLVTKHRYRIECPEARLILPYEAEFDLNSGPVHPHFQIRLPAKLERVNLTLKDQRDRTVWEQDVYLFPIFGDLKAAAAGSATIRRPLGGLDLRRLAEALQSIGDEKPSPSWSSFHSGEFPKLYQHFTSVQVLLFLEPPITQTRRLHVLLLQDGVKLEDVNPFGNHPPDGAVLIEMPGTCELLTRQKYRVGCPEAIMIVPKEAVFDQSYGKHYSSKFEILLPAKTSQLTLRIQDQENKEVWKDKVTLPETPDYEISSYSVEKLQFSATDVPAGPSKWEEFTPEASTESRKTLYRFRFPHSGSFHCTQTGLVFVVDQRVTLQYGTVRWDELRLQSAGRTPAGPLFHIDCPENAVLQLHLPHCETKPVSENMLSVAHITDDGMSFMDPVEITDTHVVINVPHLSAFGLVWGCLREIYKYIRSVSGQVLLFLTPPRKLEVLLLSNNVDVSDVKDFVKRDAPDALYIKVPSKCHLMVKQSYKVTVECPEACEIQPDEEEFDLNFGPNYHTTFEIILPPNTEKMTLAIEDQENKVWRRKVDLSAAAVTIENPQRTLKNISSKETSISTSKMKIHLYHILEDLQDSEFEDFKWILKNEKSIPSHQLEKAQRRDAVDLMVQTYVNPEAVEVTKRILTVINRNDLVQTVGNIY